ncbi:hypothetical protein ACSUZJ_12555 [Telluria sp. B2]
MLEVKTHCSANPDYFLQRKIFGRRRRICGRKYEVHNKSSELTDNVGFAGVATPIPPFLETV